MRRLWPPIGVIERELLPLVAPAGIREGTRAPARRGAPGSAGREIASLVLGEIEAPSSVPGMPASVRDLIARRVQSRNAHYSSPPTAGQVVRIEDIGKPGRNDAGLERPLMVLINAPSGMSGVWHGWLAASETDYAGCWDYVLQEGRDGIFDPVVGMIQVWNPVYLRIPENPVVLAELPPARLAAVRALAAEYVGGAVTGEAPVRPGRMWPRRVGGLQVFTGTPLGGHDDPRRRYQEIYLRASEVFQPAGAEECVSADGILGRIVESIHRWAASVGLSWTPISLIEQPMGEPLSDRPAGYQLGDIARFVLLPDPEGRSLHLRILLTRGRGFHAALLREDETIQQHELTPEAREADFFMGVDARHALLISDAKRNLQYRIPLS
jgi:hypothetical protein